MRTLELVILAALAAGCGGKLYPLPDDAGPDARDAAADARPDVIDAGLPDAPPPIIDIAANQKSPANIVVDAKNVYWTDNGNGSGDGALMAAPIGGGTLTTLASGDNPWGLALNGGDVYYTTYGAQGANGTIARVPTTGGASTVLAVGQTYPWAIAVDDENVYWTQQVEMGSVSSTPIDAVGAPPPKLLVGMAINATGLALHGGTLYWTDYNTAGEIFQVPATGGMSSLVTGYQDYPFVIFADDVNLYWSTHASVMKQPIAGGAPVTLAVADQRVIDIASDGTYLYWTDYYQGTIERVPLAGGAVATMVAGQAEAYGIAVDDKNIYWTTYGDGVAGTVEQTEKLP